MKLIYIITALLIIGCAYPKKTTFFELPENSKEKAVVYLYRTPTSIDSLNPDVPIFYVNDDKIGKLSIGGYYKILVSPGTVLFSYKTPLFGIPLFTSSQKLKFDVEASQVYYVKFSVESIMKLTYLNLIPSNIGVGEIKKTQLLVN